MRTTVIILAGLLAASSGAEAAAQPQRKPQAAGKALPKERRDNPCAAYGPGFVRIAGTDSCMKIGGGIGVGASVSGGR